MTHDSIRAFANIVKASSDIVFFGGAGVSTESGLKDYRSQGGIYTAVTEYGASPEEILSHDYFYARTEDFYRFYRDFFMGEVQPNAAHYALAELEKMGKLKAVITQNIDNLHQKAGSERVFELHGTTEKYTCPVCGEPYTKQYLRECVGVPMCKKCPNPIKPDVVLYGEQLDDSTVSMAIDAISRADTLIIGGTSLAVYPAAGFLRYFCGRHLIVINRDDTRMDSRADLVFRDSIGEVMQALMIELKK